MLLDDCLAAVDPHVARAICEEALLGPGPGLRGLTSLSGGPFAIPAQVFCCGVRDPWSWS